jgi:hypothetical protein
VSPSRRVWGGLWPLYKGLATRGWRPREWGSRAGRELRLCTGGSGRRGHRCPGGGDVGGPQFLSARGSMRGLAAAFRVAEQWSLRVWGQTPSQLVKFVNF